MIDAADAVLLVAADEERGAAVRAAVVHDADPAGAVAEGDQLFAQDHQAHRIAVRLYLGGEAGRHPVLPHEGTHDGSGANAGEVGAVLWLHGSGSSLVVFDRLDPPPEACGSGEAVAVLVCPFELPADFRQPQSEYGLTIRKPG